MNRFMRCCLILCVGGIAVTARAASSDPNLLPPPGDIVPPDPRTDSHDWIQFRNGEWLKGEIKDIQDESFTFDSDELDLLHLDLDDVYAVYSSRPNTCVLEDRTVILGKLQIVGDRVLVMTEDGERAFTRSQVRGIIPGGLSERDYWSLKFSLGWATREGNTEQSDLSSMLFLERRTPGVRTRLDYNGAYGSVNDEETINNHHAIFRHNVYLSRRFSLVLPSFEYYQDKFQNIRHRVTPGAGLSYDVLNRSVIEWGIDGGYGYQHTRFYTVEDTSEDSDNANVLLGGTDLEWDLTKRLELNLGYNITAGLDSGSSTDHHLLAVFSLELWQDLDLDLSLTWDHVGRPQPREDGSVPRRDDLRTFVGIGWEF
jgi:putative salt-induced outer membrane protein YdiY